MPCATDTKAARMWPCGPPHLSSLLLHPTLNTPLDKLYFAPVSLIYILVSWRLKWTKS